MARCTSVLLLTFCLAPTDARQLGASNGLALRRISHRDTVTQQQQPACGPSDARLAGVQRLRGGADTTSPGLMGWLQMLRRLLFPGNPPRERSALPTPQPAPKKQAAESAPKGKAKPKRGRGGAASKAGGVQAIHSKAEFEQMLKSVRSKQLVVVDFHATWCGPCQQIAPKYEAMAKALPHVKFVKVDVDEAKDLSQQVRYPASAAS